MRCDGNDSLHEVVYTLLFVAHFGGVGEELLGEEWSVEVCGRCGVDSCSQTRRCEQCSGGSEGRRRKHSICRRVMRQQGKAISKNSADGMNWPPLPITILMRLFFGKAVRVPAQIEDSL